LNHLCVMYDCFRFDMEGIPSYFSHRMVSVLFSMTRSLWTLSLVVPHHTRQQVSSLTRHYSLVQRTMLQPLLFRLGPGESTEVQGVLYLTALDAISPQTDTSFSYNILIVFSNMVLKKTCKYNCV